MTSYTLKIAFGYKLACRTPLQSSSSWRLALFGYKPMTLTQLRYLVAIADAELNITLAAARVHATQPGLSKQLKQLEDELGFLLFVRKGAAWMR
ncbi:LysR family transcriptional regulator [Xanthomonas euroxanthea]